MVELCAAVGAVCQPGEHSHFPHFCGAAALFSGFLHDLPSFRINDDLVGIFDDYPFLRGIVDFFLGFIGELGGLEIGRAPQVGILL